MKISCDVIQDLLPLYIEKIASADTVKLVDDHLLGCDRCKSSIEGMKNENSTETADTVFTASLRSVNHTIQTKKRKAVIFSSLIAFLLMFTIFSYLTRLDFIPYAQSGITVTKSSDGLIYANFSDKVTSYKLQQYQSENNQTVVEILAWTSLWDQLLDKSTPFVLIDEAADTVYYCDDSTDENMHLVYGQSPNENSGVELLPRMILGSYFVLAFLLAILLGVIWLIVKNKEHRQAGTFVMNKTVPLNICRYLFFVPVSYLCSYFLLSIDFVSFSAGRDFIMLIIAAVAIYGIILSGLSLVKQR